MNEFVTPSCLVNNLNVPVDTGFDSFVFQGTISYQIDLNRLPDNEYGNPVDTARGTKTLSSSFLMNIMLKDTWSPEGVSLISRAFSIRFLLIFAAILNDLLARY